MNSVQVSQTSAAALELLLPLIIIHWYSEYYYGGSTTIRGLKNYLLPRFRKSPPSDSILTLWANQAEQWRRSLEYHRKGAYDELLRGYNNFGLRLVVSN